MGMDETTRVRLSDDELIQRAETLAAKIQHVAHLRAKAKEDAKSAREVIEAEIDEIERLARVISEQEEERRQGELFVSQGEAEKALGEVGARACTCESENVRKIDCAVHGVVAGTPSTSGGNGEAAPVEGPP